jgi:hypothetical protein
LKRSVWPQLRETTGYYWKKWHTLCALREEWTTKMATNTKGIEDEKFES